MINYNFYQKKINKLSLAEIASKYNIELIGEDRTISGLNNIFDAKQDELSFVTNIAYLENLKTTKSLACIIDKSYLDKALSFNNEISFLSSEQAYNILGNLLELFYETKSKISGISKTSHIADSAVIGDNVTIGDNVYISNNVKLGKNVMIYPNTYIEDNVVIGDNTIIGANSTISFAIIGNNVEISGGVQIGQDGFGFAADGKIFSKVKQLGLVIIEDNVSIGANSCIDRGSLEDTIIGAGTKIDNLVQIAHNVQIGNNCLIAAQTGIAGSTKLGDYVVTGGQVGIAGHLKVGSLNRFAAQSGVTKHISEKSGDFYSMPAKLKKDWQREQITLRRITKEYFKND
jgi:UDP-3-O-[3-hydroxymyristoyl] glucosamine N-acyltransferase